VKVYRLFYGEAKRELRYRSWECLKFLNTRSSLPWLCVGDFNEVLHASEQFGGVGRAERQMDGFREAVSVCGFTDLGYIGLPYTWDNRQEGNRNVKMRLDHGLANASFLSLFRQVKIWHVQNTLSDHCCLVVE
jgi:endonuclease/exonuclease/phosphatase family metal-dependent hydrolase